MLRRALAIGTIVCLLAGLIYVPTAPSLVCLMTGRTMPAVAAADAPDSCCAVMPIIAADGAITGYALARPSCCDLRFTPERPQPPAIMATVDAAVAVWAPVPSILFFTPPLAMIAAPPLPRESMPRAPPLLRSASPRAPPFFS